ncbi:MAG TPA: FecR domain-containing protein [Puia sp.]|jgi:ferric-dicitrate binding protein FerR (iron transport regulator)
MEVSQRLSYLFRRYLSKDCTPAERDELFDLLLQSEHDLTLRRLIDETWKNDFPTYTQDKQSANTILRHIVSRREPETPPEETEGPTPGFSRSRQFSLRIVLINRWAAAILGLTFIAFLALYHHPTPSRPTPLPLLAVAQPMTDRCMTLSDGSTVLLNQDARLDYQKGFNKKTREVTLHGEAYFAIHHDPRPFIVHTGSVRTIVLGTAFNINASSEKDIVITVTKGKVKVENGIGEYSILRRNEQLRLDSLHTRLRKVPVDAGEALTWKKPYLIFNDVTMKEAVDELAAHFHADIVFANPVAGNCPVTASFTERESLEAIIKVLSKINNMEYTIDHGKVVISGEGCK